VAEDEVALGDQPIVFEDINIRQNFQEAADPNISGAHLYVLVHGFQGSSLDMQHIRNYIFLYDTNALVMNSMNNEEMTTEDIWEMGMRLATEITQYVEEYVPGESLRRLSFIGHSLGGLIIRASLKFLSHLWDKMYMLMTLASPHLGFMYSSSKIVNAGLWVLRQWKNSPCI
jgi:triacylglycerol esterase/lipase EstA (alpha/beta hydrolase family)